MEKTKRKQSFFSYLKERNKNSIALIVLMALYAAFCIGSLIYFAVIGYGRDCLISVAYLIVIPIFYLVEYGLKIRSPLPYTVFILVYCVFCFLGASYNFYTKILILDDILHACWGLLFTTLGFCVIKSLVGEPKNAKQFAAYLLFAVGFCMILSIIWEIYEFSCDRLMPNFDMQEDTVIDGFNSFLLHDPYDHLNTLKINGIAYTQLFDKDGNLLYEIKGGYLDIGLIDTMMDIIWCVIFTTAYCVFLAVDKKLGGKIYPHIVPAYVGGETDSDAAEPPQEDDGNEQLSYLSEKLNEFVQDTADKGQEQMQNAQSEDIKE